eukprot:6881708-Prymnesium_polylepis.1
MREAGVTALQTFLFQPPMVTKPSLALTFAMPAALDAKEVRPAARDPPSAARPPCARRAGSLRRCSDARPLLCGGHAAQEFVELLQQDRVGQEWMQLLTSSHDAAAAKGNA